MFPLKKYFFFIIFFLVAFSFFGQKKIVKKISILNEIVEINTLGLDDVILQNSDNNFLELYLYAEDYDEQSIITEKLENKINVKFNFEGTQTREVIFRKFITKRLQRANLVVKIPKNKEILILGEDVDITSNSIHNKLSIFIDNGILKLNSIQKDMNIQLYSGNVFANYSPMNFNLKSNLGTIKVDDKSFKKVYKKDHEEGIRILKINSIKANIFITK